MRRLLRIWPLYFFFLAAIFLFSVVFRQSIYSSLFAVRPIYFAAYLLFAGNFAIYFLGLTVDVLTPLWSISVEEQFYLLWPWAVRKAGGRRQTGIAVTLLLISTLSRVLLWQRGIPAVRVWFNTFARLDPIAAGILLATLGGDPIGLRRSARALLVLGGSASWWLVAYYCPLMWLTGPTLQTVIGFPVVALVSLAFLMAALGAGSAEPSPSSRVLIYLGKISYGLYVYHALALIVAAVVCIQLRQRAGWNLPALRALYLSMGTLFTLALATSSYRFLEAPFLRLKRRFTYVESRPV